MKKDIHPEYYPEAKVVCSCGNSWTTGSTRPEIRTDICSACHPFFTGQMQRLVDRGGQVERFQRRLEQAEGLREEANERLQSKEQRRRARQLVEIVDEEDVEAIDLNEDNEPEE